MANRSAATDASQQPRSDPEHDQVNLAQVFSHQNRILGRVVQSLRQRAPQPSQAESPIAEPVEDGADEAVAQSRKVQANAVVEPLSSRAASRARASPLEPDDYPLGADAMPSTEPGHGARRRGSQALGAGTAAFREGRLDALLKLGTTAATASTAQDWGEGLGGAVGGLAGSALGAAVSKYAGKNVEYGKVVGGFFGDKAGAALGKRLAPEPESDIASEAGAATTTTPHAATEALPGSIEKDLLAGVGIGSVAGIHAIGKDVSVPSWRKLQGWLGNNSPAANEPSPLGADAGPSPTDIGKRPPPWKTVGEVLKDEGKNVLLEAVLKAGHTYATATTAEQAWAGYGGAVGGLIGSVGGAVVVKRFLPFINPSIGMTVGGTLGDEAGTAVGGWIGRQLVGGDRQPEVRKPLPAVSLLDPAKQRVTPVPNQPFVDLQLGAQTGKRLLSSPELARQQPVERRLLTQVSLLDPLKHSLTPLPKTEYVDEQVSTRITRHLLTHAAARQQKAAKQPSLAPVSLLRPTSRERLDEAPDDRPLPMRVPPPATALPEPASLPTSQAKEPQPINHHYTFNTNMPVTVDGNLDDPAVMQRLEAMVQRTLQELISRQAATQLSDPIYA
ncbi:hypothetical protein ACIQUF_08610 [Pseudomonas sp. NPDC090233]|uniref:hypothetical protein n=1 Tax=Pseudomonas sp. NPDC090233 TaxID=3364479 RepID=UPI00383A9F6D